MAKIEIIKEADGDAPASLECLEVNVWSTGGRQGQLFSIGSGSNFNANANFWLEIRYSVQGFPLLYTRNILQSLEAHDTAGLEAALEKFLNEEYASFGFGEMLPETTLSFKRKKSSYTEPGGETRHFVSYSLEVAADLGAVFGYTPPGDRMLVITLEGLELEQGLAFMRQLIHELGQVSQGRHPDPASLPAGQGDWPFARQLNRQAYDRISPEYREDYFTNPVLAKAFDGWLAKLPGGGHILDAGCGHGHPVITRLLDKGFQVTGSDLSPAMLARARAQFAGVQFWERAISEIEAESVFDGACSFSSLLYLDPIDLLHSIFRLYRALKPGGLLFLYGYDLHPDWRGHPYHEDLKQWMWGETYGMDEIAHILEEHGYFKVLKKLDTTTRAELKERIQKWRIQSRMDYEALVKKLPPESHVPFPDFSKPRSRPAYAYVVMAKKQAPRPLDLLK